MIYEAKDGMWVHSHDLTVSTPGREDVQEDVINCAIYLGHRENRRRGPSHTSALKAKSAIATALVRNSIRPSKATENDQELIAANRTIDRLLAFVPVRSPSIAAARLAEILRELDHIASHSFPGFERTAITVEQESERDTTACHRITVRVLVTALDDINALVEGTTAVHLALAGMATPEELQAITLLVEPERS